MSAHHVTCHKYVDMHTCMTYLMHMIVFPGRCSFLTLHSKQYAQAQGPTQVFDCCFDINVINTASRKLLNTCAKSLLFSTVSFKVLHEANKYFVYWHLKFINLIWTRTNGIMKHNTAQSLLSLHNIFAYVISEKYGSLPTLPEFLAVSRQLLRFHDALQ